MTSYLQQAIKLAIEGGYDARWHEEWGAYRSKAKEGWRALSTHLIDEQILLDPLFYQSLGKSLGWGECSCGCHPARGHEKGFVNCIHCKHIRHPGYLYHAHRFLDHVMEGKDAEEFFRELIEKR